MNAVLADGDGVQFNTRRFHLRMAVVFVLIAFGGFAPSYWAPVFSGTFHMPPIAHIHGILLFSWTLFYLAQTAWVAAGRTPAHRAWGDGWHLAVQRGDLLDRRSEDHDDPA